MFSFLWNKKEIDLHEDLPLSTVKNGPFLITKSIRRFANPIIQRSFLEEKKTFVTHVGEWIQASITEYIAAVPQTIVEHRIIPGFHGDFEFFLIVLNG